MTNSIIDTKLYVPLHLGDIPQQNRDFMTNRQNIAHLGSQLLLYDRILVPTMDFGIVPVLIEWMGLRLFLEALSTGAFFFIRRREMVGYGGNGLSISGFRIDDTQASPFTWWQECLWRDTEQAIEQQLRHVTTVQLTSRHIRDISSLVLRNYQEFPLMQEVFMPEVRDETYKDISFSDEILNVVRERVGQNGAVDLDHLPGVGPDQIQVQITQNANAIDLILEIAELNVQKIMAKQNPEADLLTSPAYSTLMYNKLVRHGIKPDLLSAFMAVLDLNDIPDIRGHIADGTITLSEIWNLRKTRESQNFRKWISDANTRDPRELERAYVASLKRPELKDKSPLRLLRFGTTSVIGVLNTPAGLAVSAIDSFAVDKLFPGRSPKLFLDKLMNLDAVAVGRRDQILAK